MVGQSANKSGRDGGITSNPEGSQARLGVARPARPRGGVERREIAVSETNGGVDLFIRINNATSNKIYVPANALPYVIDKVDVFDLWITASGAADLNIVAFK